MRLSLFRLKMLWLHAIRLICSFSLSWIGDTLYEIYCGKCTDYVMLRTFGCAVFFHLSEGKLEPRAKKCVFLNYPEGVKGYRLWDRSHKGVRIIISRDKTYSRYFNKSSSEMLFMKSEEPIETTEEQSLITTEWVSVYIPTTPNKVESNAQNQ